MSKVLAPHEMDDKGKEIKPPKVKKLASPDKPKEIK